MSEKDIVIQEADDVAEKFLSVRVPGDREQHLKAIVKIIPQHIKNDFLDHLSTKLKEGGIETVRVNHDAISRKKLTLSAIVDSFIRDLSRGAPTGEWEKLLGLRKSILLAYISFSEAYKLIDECMDLKRQQFKKPLIFLVNLGDLLSNYDTLKFVNMLRNLARECGYQWFITSHSPLLMLFLGELPSSGQYYFQEYQYEAKCEDEFVIKDDSNIIVIPSKAIDTDKYNFFIVSNSNSVFLFGDKIDDDFGASCYDFPLNFAIIEANIGGNIVLDFSSHLNFRLVPRETMFENLNHELKAFVHKQVRKGFNLFDLYVMRAEREDQINHHVLLTPKSFIHIHVIGKESDKDFLFMVN